MGVRNRRRSYLILAWIFLSSGLILTPISYFLLRSTVFTALGSSLLILSAVLLALSSGLPRLPEEAGVLMMETSMRNISRLIEELGLRSKALYLPSRLSGNLPLALIPLRNNPEPPIIRRSLPNRLIVKYGDEAWEMGLLVETPGTMAFKLFEKPEEATASTLESSLSTLLVNLLGLVDGVRVSIEGDRSIVELLNPRIELGEELRVNLVLGSPLASTVAQLMAESLDKSIIIEEEEQREGKLLIKMRIIGE